MAQTKRKRQTKHRGNAAGSVTARGRTGKAGPDGGSGKKSGGQGQKKTREELRQERLNRRPTWTSMAQRAALASIVMLVLLLFVTKGHSIISAFAVAVIAFVLYVPGGYYLETWMWRRRMAKQGKPTT